MKIWPHSQRLCAHLTDMRAFTWNKMRDVSCESVHALRLQAKTSPPLTSMNSEVHRESASLNERLATSFVRAAAAEKSEKINNSDQRPCRHVIKTRGRVTLLHLQWTFLRMDSLVLLVDWRGEGNVFV